MRQESHKQLIEIMACTLSTSTVWFWSLAQKNKQHSFKTFYTIFITHVSGFLHRYCMASFPLVILSVPPAEAKSHRRRQLLLGVSRQNDETVRWLLVKGRLGIFQGRTVSLANK